jgi:periplasmic protein TonB
MSTALAILRRAAPWIASLLAHALLVVLLPLSVDLGSRRAPAVERRVVLQLEDADEPRHAPADATAPLIDASSLQLPSRLPLPDAPSVDSAPIVVSAVGPRAVPAAGSAPSAREILDALPTVTTTTGAAARADAAASVPSVRVEWSGTPRTLSREVKPRFPSVLSTTGQEAEVIARITVSPLGAVIDVEITRGSGYIEIDAAVESALRQCLYTRIEGKQNQIGTVYYRFPLEKRD